MDDEDSFVSRKRTRRRAVDPSLGYYHPTGGMEETIAQDNKTFYGDGKSSTRRNTCEEFTGNVANNPVLPTSTTQFSAVVRGVSHEYELEEREVTVDQFLKTPSVNDKAIRKRPHRVRGQKSNKEDAKDLQKERIQRRIQHIRTIGSPSIDTSETVVPSLHARWKPTSSHGTMNAMESDAKPSPVKRRSNGKLRHVKFLPREWSQQPLDDTIATKKGKRSLQNPQRKIKHLPSLMPPLSFESFVEHEAKLKTWFRPSVQRCGTMLQL
ncbi:hypothetical protein PIIN_00333 [Serendipita indica DSM 11827]|uniref:Uncharacterized protein n=1 Tax=Serendipita indica (strain DSM 11827) TaxID=1109443 RepID=G4T5N7_SERID|nr:hypothetical protein PIIN_00333 [Serendipita indica DSM 11827]